MKDWTFTEEQDRALRCRTMDCPFFLASAIKPIPRYLMGRVPLDVIEERTFLALSIWHNHSCRSDLEESYAPEGEFIRRMVKAFAGRDLAIPEDLAAFEQDVLQTLTDYVEAPVTQRKYYVL